jgi:hypothetical protein
MAKSEKTTSRGVTKPATRHKRTPRIPTGMAPGVSHDITANIAVAAAKDAPVSPQEEPPRSSRSDQATKLERLVGLLRRPGGASLAELCTATGWQAHSVRGALAGALKHKGFAVRSEKVEGIRRYRITAPA